MGRASWQPATVIDVVRRAMSQILLELCAQPSAASSQSAFDADVGECLGGSSAIAASAAWWTRTSTSNAFVQSGDRNTRAPDQVEEFVAVTTRTDNHELVGEQGFGPMTHADEGPGLLTVSPKTFAAMTD